MTTLEDRTVPAVIPMTGPNGGAWVKVDTLIVSTRTNQNVSTGVTSNVVLDAGVNYLAVASGEARIANDTTGLADAEYIRYNKPGDLPPQDGSSPGFRWNNHGVRIAGVDGGDTTGNFWGEYEADHVYVREVTGQGTKVKGWYSDIPGYYGDNSGTLTVNIFAEMPIVLDLDVDANSQLGNKLGDLTVDGAANYLPGYEGGTQKLFSGTFNSGTFTPQRMKIVLDGIGSDTPKIARVVFKVTSTRLPGYASNMTDPKVTGAGKENDFSFHRDIDSDVYTIDVNSRERRDEGDPQDGRKVIEGGVMEGSKTWLNFFAKDFGGAATVTAEVFTTDDANKPAQTFTLKVPADEDNDGIADKWEKAMLERWKAQYRQGANFDTTDLTFFSKNDDKEQRDPDGKEPDGTDGRLVPQKEEGDAHTVFEEYRGYILDGGGLDGQGKNGHASGHIRLDPARKEILVEVDRAAVLNNVPAGGLSSILNGASGVFSNSDRGAGIYMYWLLDQTLPIAKEDLKGDDDEIMAKLRVTRNVALESDFLHLLFVDEGVISKDSPSPAATFGREQAAFPPNLTNAERLRSRGVIIGTTEMQRSPFLPARLFPNRSELFMTAVAHELVHLLIQPVMINPRQGDVPPAGGAFDPDEHTVGDLNKNGRLGDPDDLASIMGAALVRQRLELATAKFFPVVQAELLTKSGEWATL